MSASLPYRIAGRVSGIQDQRSPTIARGAGVDAIALAVTDLVADEDSVGFVVRVTLRLDAERYADFKYVDQAVVVTLEAPETRELAAFRLIDPDMPYLEEASPNYQPPANVAARRPSPVRTTGFVSAPIQVRCRPLRAEGEAPWRGLWVQASLQELRSKRIHVHPRNQPYRRADAHEPDRDHEPDPDPDPDRDHDRDHE